MASDRSVKLFREATERIPAYGAFLKANGFDANTIRTSEDFNKVPLTSKKTYLQAYPLSDLVWDGSLDTPLLFCATSGSTGTPYYFPRSDELSYQYSVLIESYLSQASKKKSPILVINAFGMGVWIGGILTHRAFEIASARMNAPVSLLPVGYNKPEIFKALKQLAPNFDQVILIGYPPFIKEIVDQAEDEGVDLKKLNTRFLFAAESFTETFRDYLCRRTGADPIRDTLNIYGTADIGAMAYETPLSIFIRREAAQDPLLFQDIFGQIEKTPTLAQFNPRFMEFEAVDGEVVLTGNSGLPLIRYAVGDHGGVIDFEEMRGIFGRFGRNLVKEIEKAGIKDAYNKHPFVYVYERINFATTLHGMLVYPEFIKEGLLSPEVIPVATEKFTMQTKYDVRHNQFLEINIELQKGVEADEVKRHLILNAVRTSLIKKSSEFAEISKSGASTNLIRLVLWPFEHEKYFKPGVKQKWVVPAGK